MTWFNHLQYTGGTSFQKNLGNLQRVAGVVANIGHGGGGAEGILDDVPAYVQVYDFGRTGPEARARLESEVRSPSSPPSTLAREARTSSLTTSPPPVSS